MFGGAGLRLPGNRERGAASEQAAQTARTQVKWTSRCRDLDMGNPPPEDPGEAVPSGVPGSQLLASKMEPAS